MLQALHRPDASLLLPASYLDTMPLLEWKTYVRVVRDPLQIHAVAESDVAGKFRGPHLGHETVRQVSIVETPPLSIS